MAGMRRIGGRCKPVGALVALGRSYGRDRKFYRPAAHTRRQSPQKSTGLRNTACSGVFIAQHRRMTRRRWLTIISVLLTALLATSLKTVPKAISSTQADYEFNDSHFHL